MVTINKQQRIPAPPAAILEVINDIEHYPQFLPWCRDAQILTRDANAITARLDIDYKGFNDSFTTRNVLQDNAIRMQLVNGPFRHLDGAWRCTPMSDGTTLVCLTLDFAFKNKAATLVMTPAFSKMGEIMVKRFCQQVIEQV